MKRNLREWLPTVLLSGLLVGVAIASNLRMLSPSSSQNTQNDVLLGEGHAESIALPERRTVRKPPRPMESPAAHSLSALPIAVEIGSNTVLDEQAIPDEQRRMSELERRERLKPRARNMERIPSPLLDG
jgi:hypothetical protein